MMNSSAAQMLGKAACQVFPEIDLESATKLAAQIQEGRKLFDEVESNWRNEKPEEDPEDGSET